MQVPHFACIHNNRYSLIAETKCNQLLHRQAFTNSLMKSLHQGYGKMLYLPIHLIKQMAPVYVWGTLVPKWGMEVSVLVNMAFSHRPDEAFSARNQWKLFCAIITYTLFQQIRNTYYYVWVCMYVCMHALCIQVGGKICKSLCVDMYACTWHHICNCSLTGVCYWAQVPRTYFLQMEFFALIWECFLLINHDTY